MSTNLTAHQLHRPWHAVVVAAVVAVLLVVVITVMSYAVTGGGGTDRPAPITVVTQSDHTPTPGDGLPCPIHEVC